MHFDSLYAGHIDKYTTMPAVNDTLQLTEFFEPVELKNCLPAASPIATGRAKTHTMEATTKN